MNAKKTSHCFMSGLKSISPVFMVMAILLSIALVGCGSGEQMNASITGSGTAVPSNTPVSSGSPVPSGTATATLSWSAPSSNLDGTPLLDLAGYKIYYGTSSGNYSGVVNIGNATTYQLTNLPAGTTIYFAVTVYTADGQESGPSNEVSKFVS